jgi:hypothetical protein
MAVRSNYMVTVACGRRLTVKAAASLVRPGMWQRMRTGSATKGAKDYHRAMIEITPDDTPERQDPGQAVLLLRRTAIPAPSAANCAGPRTGYRWRS